MDIDNLNLHQYLYYVQKINPKYKIICRKKNAVFIDFKDAYYMYYNEESILNGNELNIPFQYTGIIRYDNKVYYYIGFDKHNFSNTLLSINKKLFNIIIIKSIPQELSVDEPNIKKLNIISDYMLTTTKEHSQYNIYDYDIVRIPSDESFEYL